MGEIPNAPESERWVLMATNWAEIFKRRPDLDPPGHDEAARAAAAAWQRKKEQEQCQRPKGRGKRR